MTVTIVLTTITSKEAFAKEANLNIIQQTKSISSFPYNTSFLHSAPLYLPNTTFKEAKQLSLYLLNVKYDKFGILKIYPTKPGGEEWFMNMNNPNTDNRTRDAITDNATFIKRNSDNDNSWKATSKEVRFTVLTPTGFQENQITTLNQKELAAKGYILRHNDWKNVEMTGYFKVNNSTKSNDNGGPHIELVARGGRSTDSKQIRCEATSYHSNTYIDGRVKFEKDLMHTSGYTSNSQDPERQNALSPLQGKWIGIKAVFYNLPNGTVKLEQWVDDSSDNIKSPGNSWHKVLEFVDHGQWGGGHPNCGGTDHTIITWGGPIAIFRWDEIPDMDVKYFSIREINIL